MLLDFMIALFVFRKSSWLRWGRLRGGRALRLEACRIQASASLDSHGGVVWVDFADPHEHLIVYLTVSSARTHSNFPVVGAPLSLPRSFKMGA
jgi:hypothetical protein